MIPFKKSVLDLIESELKGYNDQIKHLEERDLDSDDKEFLEQTYIRHETLFFLRRMIEGME